MITLSALLGGLGLTCMLYRRTVLGVLIGIQLLTMGATLLFVLSGSFSGPPIEGHISGLFVCLSGVALLVVGYALAVRLFYLRKQAGMSEVKALKH